MCSSVEHKYKEANVLKAVKVAMCTFILQNQTIMWQVPSHCTGFGYTGTCAYF